MRVRVLRQATPTDEPYWEAFDYDGPGDASVADVLDWINYHDDIVTVEGRRTTRIGWECSCLQGVCGACAMVVDDVPALACETFLGDLRANELTIRPLRKFPTIHDLAVDRSAIQENLRRNDVFVGEYQPDPKADHGLQYAAAKCLKCGLCMEVCPNYVDGASFFGAAFANDCYLVRSRNRGRSAEMGAAYAEHFGSSCSKALSCMAVCPAGIPIVTSIARMNRVR